MYCKNCGIELEEDALFCADCGVLVGNGDAYCPECGVQTNNGKRFCTKCGADLLGDVVFIKSDKPILKSTSSTNQNSSLANKNDKKNNANESNQKDDELRIKLIEQITIPDDAKTMVKLAYELLNGFMSSNDSDSLLMSPLQSVYYGKIDALYTKAKFKISDTKEFCEIEEIFNKARNHKKRKMIGFIIFMSVLGIFFLSIFIIMPIVME